MVEMFIAEDQRAVGWADFKAGGCAFCSKIDTGQFCRHLWVESRARERWMRVAQSEFARVGVTHAPEAGETVDLLWFSVPSTSTSARGGRRLTISPPALCSRAGTT